MADEVDGGDGTRLLTGVDLYEISLTATPMHPDAKVVSWKSAPDSDPVPTDARQRARASELGIDELAAKSATTATPISVATFEC